MPNCVDCGKSIAFPDWKGRCTQCSKTEEEENAKNAERQVSSEDMVADTASISTKNPNKGVFIAIGLVVFFMAFIVIVLVSANGQSGPGELMNLAKSGDEEAQYDLGMYYKNAAKKGKSLSKAVEWLSKAAESGNTEAWYQLGMLYIECKEHLYSDGNSALEKASEQGYAEAQVELGKSEQMGRGTSRNETMALKWFIIAAHNGSQEGDRLARESMEKLPESEIQTALTWVRWELPNNSKP